jgi:hypothetical protein
LIESRHSLGPGCHQQGDKCIIMQTLTSYTQTCVIVLPSTRTAATTLELQRTYPRRETQIISQIEPLSCMKPCPGTSRLRVKVRAKADMRQGVPWALCAPIIVTRIDSSSQKPRTALSPLTHRHNLPRALGRTNEAPRDEELQVESCTAMRADRRNGSTRTLGQCSY